MMKLKSTILSVALAALCLCSCQKVHEFPGQGRSVDPTDIETRINVECKVQITGFDIVTKGSQRASELSDSAAFYERRFIVNIHSSDSSDELVESHTVVRDVTDESPLAIDTKLHTRKYKVVVWMDYVKKGTQTDLYYLTSNGTALNAVHQPSADNYRACSDFKDVQTFVSDIDLTPYAGQWFADITIPAPLERPVAKITVLANDLAEYAAHIGYEGSLEKLAEDIEIEFSYDGYFPTGFNAHTGKLNDSQLGYGFNSPASYPYDFEQKDYTRIGFDYVFVNGDSSSVTITVKIKTKGGKLINVVNNVVVPITRGKETVLIYKFFTKEYVPGIGINPEFDGEFNVYV